MKVFAALGPGDIVAAYREQIGGRPILSETSITYSGQLFEFCRVRGIEVLALSHNRRVDSLRDGLLQLENRPRRFEGRGGAYHHLSNVAYAFYLVERAWRFGADVALINHGSCHHFALAAFRAARIPVAVNFHGTLWPNGFRPVQGVGRLVLWLDKWFLRHIAAAAAGVSPECEIQVRQLAGQRLPFFEYRAQFRKDGFPSPDADKSRIPFRVVFVGRAERNKGVLDIPEIAEQVRAKSKVRVLFEVCGDGSALSELTQVVKSKRIDDIIRIHGRLTRPELLAVYGGAHAVIVPTRSDFCEGLPKTCAEAVLCGRPIITSRLSNAIPVLGPAIAEAQPDDIDSYVNAILTLAEDPATYERLRNACAELSLQFLDRSRSYPAAMDRLLVELFPGWKPLDSYERLFDQI